MAGKDCIDQSPQPPNPNTRKRRVQALPFVVAYSFGHDTSTFGHIEYLRGKGDKKLINSGGKEVKVHFPKQS